MYPKPYSNYYGPGITLFAYFKKGAWKILAFWFLFTVYIQPLPSHTPPSQQQTDTPNACVC